MASYHGDYDPLTILQRISSLPPSYVPPNRGPFLTSFSIASTSLALLVISIRLATRRYISKGLDASDWLILGSGLSMLGGTVAWVLGIRQGVIGMHLVDTLVGKGFEGFFEVEGKVIFTLKLIFAYQIHYVVTLLLIKLSLLLFYRRLLNPATGRTILHVIHGTIIALVLYTLISIFLLTFQCTPVGSYWNPRQHYSLCPHWTKMRQLYIGILAFSVFSDFWVLLLPTTFIFSLSGISRPKKLKAVAIFTVGTGACAAAVVRIFLAATKEMYKDITWDFALMIFWGQVEMAVAIICACLPAVNMLWVERRKRRESRLSRGSGQEELSRQTSEGEERVSKFTSTSLASADDLEKGTHSFGGSSLTQIPTARTKRSNSDSTDLGISDTDSFTGSSRSHIATQLRVAEKVSTPTTRPGPAVGDLQLSEFEKWERGFAWEGGAVGAGSEVQVPEAVKK